MLQIRVVLEDSVFKFVKNHSQHGFKSKTELVNEAISFYRQQLQQKLIAESAQLDREIYEEDELQELTDDAAAL